MALDTNIRGISGIQADVDANSNLIVRTPQVLSQSGFCAIAGRIDDGTVVAGGRTNRIYVTEGNSLKAAIGTLLWDDTFNMTAQNTSKYKAPVTTQTVTFPGGFAVLNGSSIVTANTNSAIQTYRAFPLFAKSELRCNTSALITAVPQANAVTEFGLFSAALPGAAIPTDGVFFRFNTAGALVGVVNYNGTEFATAAFSSPSINVNHDYLIVAQTNSVTFWIDDVLLGTISLLSAVPTNGQPFMSGSQPYTARHYIGATPPGSAMQFKISDVFITYLGPDLNKPWPHVKAGFGHMAYQGQNGGTMGSTAAITNSQAAGAGAALTNTTALATGLGGQAAILPTLAVPTDGIVCSFQNPVATVNVTGRNLIITGINIAGTVTTALTGGPVVYAYTIAFGHTAVSLATAEAATTKAPRRVSVGFQTWAAAAAVGTTPANVTIMFQSPIVVAPGEFIALCAKNFGVVTTAGVITLLVGFDAHFE